jgi:hypothetical protein
MTLVAGEHATATGSNLACRRGPPAPRLVRLLRDEPTVFSLVRRSFRGELEARLAESARRRSPYFGARSLPVRFLAVNAIRIRWEILRACIF